MDIKTPNIVVSEPNATWTHPAFKVVKMIDFGLVFTKEDLDAMERLMGTEGFRPPVRNVLTPYDNKLKNRANA
jgi:serine/threonine protein kinase